MQSGLSSGGSDDRPGMETGDGNVDKKEIVAPPAKEPSALLLEKAIRGIVREELKNPGKESAALTPTALDAFWLFILLGNITFVLWFFSESQIASKRLDLLTKIVPWLGTSAFALGYTWARDQILALTRKRLFKIGQLMLFVLLSLSQLPILAIRPRIQPDDAQARIGDQKESRKNGDRVWLTLGTYGIRVDLLTRQLADSLTTPADFELGYSDLLGGLWGRGSQPQWYLKYRTDIVTSGPRIDITIDKTDSGYDRTFLSSNPHTFAGLPVKVKDAHTLQIRGSEGEAGDIHSLELPFGVYEIKAEYAACHKESTTQKIDMNNRSIERFKVTFEECP